ncbi:ATP-binding protein [Pedobacter antarcticus]|uniref:PAS domain-containing sensor histidine kinase n=1 Tax=Pedobacter antarcticus TaxID=34086 RepID=UPI00293179A0|nr:ATP-binding protein [Pedobacter antarcticus]
MEEKNYVSKERMNYTQETECGSYVRTNDWSKHPLGRFNKWPESLTTTISLLLNSSLPTLLLWGPERYIFYNEAFRPSLGFAGNHPVAIGQCADCFWLATWPSSQLLLPDAQTGIAAANIQDHPLPLYRNNQLEDAFWTFNSSVLTDLQGNQRGVLVTCFETTDKVVALKKLQGDQNTISQTRTSDILNTEERLRLATEATGIGSWDIDLVTKAIIYTPTLMEICGFPRNAIISLPELAAMIHPEDQNTLKEARDHALISGIFHAEVRICWEDQTEHWVNTNGRLLLDENDKPVRMLGTCIDITERKIEQLQKNDFIALASHELKTPLTSVKAYIQLLKSGRSGNDMNTVKDLASRAEHQVNKMTRLIYSFMDISRIQSGHLELNMSPFMLDDLIRELTADFQIHTSSHHITFKAGISAPIFGDKVRMGQVIENLISNAIKYSPVTKNIELSSWISGDEAIVAVKDNGIGIEPKNQEKIFERFYRAADEKAINASGFGIGLYICAGIIKKHNGGIWLNSEPGKGTTFYISLPVYQEKKD